MAAAYVGILQQQRRNNFQTIILLIGFPLIIMACVWAFLYFNYQNIYEVDYVNTLFFNYVPYILIGVSIWFIIAYLLQSAIINASAGSHTLSRKDNKRVYNLVENLCIAEGMPMPKLRIIDSPALNAFASGINKKSYAVTLTSGIIGTLNDDELEGVIAHELMHIKNHDVRLLIVSIIFVGIFSFIINMVLRGFLYGRRKKDARMMIIVIAIAAVAYLLSILFKFAISRKREFMADSGAAQMTKKPMALASALRKISGNHHVKQIKNDDVAQLCIENSPKKGDFSLSNLFSTHPPIDKRIAILEQF